MIRLRNQWRHFWFAPASPTNLGCCRIVFYGFLLLLYFQYDFSRWAEVADVFWQPTWLFTTFQLPLLSKQFLVVMQSVWKVALALSCIGLWSRVSTMTAFLLGVYLIGLPHCFGKIHHNEAIVVLVLGVMAVSWCGDSYSLDCWFWRRHHTPLRPTHAIIPSGEYTWPIRMVWFLLAVVFCAAGIAKLGHSGIAWALSDHFALTLIKDNYPTGRADPLTSWGLYLAQYNRLCQAFAAMTIVVELGYPLALISRTARWFFVPATCVMLVGIRLLMGPAFPQFLICSLFWVPWDRVGTRLCAWLPIFSARETLTSIPQSKL